MPVFVLGCQISEAEALGLADWHEERQWAWPPGLQVHPRHLRDEVSLFKPWSLHLRRGANNCLSWLTEMWGKNTNEVIHMKVSCNLLKPHKNMKHCSLN